MAKLTREDVEKIVKDALNRGVLPNFSKANLSRVDLTGADLGGANFTGAELLFANFTKADLRDADLTGADLCYAYLGWANLSRTSFAHADLTGADLSEADLAGANLNGAILTKVDLSEANLSRAQLDFVDLTVASLVKADLSRTSLVKADLGGADLSGANLNKANLFLTNLNETNLTEVDLTGAGLFGTIFASVDLSEVKGLDAANHHVSSPVSTDTLALSKGKIPEVFLQGCGLSDWEIENAKLYNPDLTESQITDITHKIRNLLLRDLNSESPQRLSSLPDTEKRIKGERIRSLEKQLILQHNALNRLQEEDANYVGGVEKVNLQIQIERQQEIIDAIKYELDKLS